LFFEKVNYAKKI